MKYRHKNHSPHLLYELMLSEPDTRGLAVYYQPIHKTEGVEDFNYMLFRPVDMIEVKESQIKQGV